MQEGKIVVMQNITTGKVKGRISSLQQQKFPEKEIQPKISDY